MWALPVILLFNYGYSKIPFSYTINSPNMDPEVRFEVDSYHISSSRIYVKFNWFGLDENKTCRFNLFDEIYTTANETISACEEIIYENLKSGHGYNITIYPDDVPMAFKFNFLTKKINPFYSVWTSYKHSLLILKWELNESSGYDTKFEVSLKCPTTKIKCGNSIRSECAYNLQKDENYVSFRTEPNNDLCRVMLCLKPEKLSCDSLGNIFKCETCVEADVFMLKGEIEQPKIYLEYLSESGHLEFKYSPPREFIGTINSCKILLTAQIKKLVEPRDSLILRNYSLNQQLPWTVIAEMNESLCALNLSTTIKTYDNVPIRKLFPGYHFYVTVWYCTNIFCLSPPDYVHLLVNNEDFTIVTSISAIFTTLSFGCLFLLVHITRFWWRATYIGLAEYPKFRLHNTESFYSFPIASLLYLFKMIPCDPILGTGSDYITNTLGGEGYNFCFAQKDLGEDKIRVMKYRTKYGKIENNLGDYLSKKQIPFRIYDYVKFEELPEYAKLLRENDLYELSRVYVNIMMSVPVDITYIHEEKLTKFNRDVNIVPNNSNRVILVRDDFGRNDYICAAHVPGIDATYSYIVTQAPSRKTTEEFIRMLIENGVKTVVQLCNMKEDGYNPKYSWINRSTKDAQMSPINMKVNQKLTTDDYDINEVTFTNANYSLLVRHFHYKKWPDYGVVKNYISFENFRNCIDQWSASNPSPIVVYCLTGSGRTGVFVAYDYNIRRMQKNMPECDVGPFLRKFEECRPQALQTLSQLDFLYELLTRAAIGTKRAKRIE